MEEATTPATWDRAGLEAINFQGFVPLVGLKTTDIPTWRGVYAILRPTLDPPVILDNNPIVGTRYTVYSAAELAARWNENSPVVYIGKAAGAAGLRDRLKPFSRKATNHSGGRSIWQLADADDLLVCWKELPDPPAQERAFLKAFRTDHNDNLPFANRNGGRDRKARVRRTLSGIR